MTGRNGLAMKRSFSHPTQYYSAPLTQDLPFLNIDPSAQDPNAYPFPRTLARQSSTTSLFPSSRSTTGPSGRPPTRQMTGMTLDRSRRDSTASTIRPTCHRAKTTSSIHMSKKASFASLVDHLPPPTTSLTLTPETWPTFKKGFKASLKAAGMYKMLNGEIPAPIRRRDQRNDAAYDEAMEDFLAKRSEARLFLNASLGPELFERIQDRPVEDMWKSLVRLYEGA
ncbi:BQ5605_C002g01131 [Microbotryum silenes-dioicae]|uniref:BQ5605_C002g01131 protein n=1 Tax=Microbotryum silenes-dioicae TaxID=796604 RepID=A0A2X0M1R7_9BASI|nr:BQ5605_C002g01131 [Microbotryum silenes-dioicae]